MGKGDYKMTDKQKMEATRRALMALATDLANATESAARLRVQIEALAALHGVEIPEPLSLS
jgi:hypothetical protein